MLLNYVAEIVAERWQHPKTEFQQFLFKFMDNFNRNVIADKQHFFWRRHFVNKLFSSIKSYRRSNNSFRYAQTDDLGINIYAD